MRETVNVTVRDRMQLDAGEVHMAISFRFSCGARSINVAKEHACLFLLRCVS